MALTLPDPYMLEGLSMAEVKKLILLFSGGLDSTVALYDFLAQGKEVKTLSVHYGQRHEKELQAAEKISAKAGVEHRVVDLSNLRPFLAGSSQTSDIEVPEGHYTEESMKLTVVPNRNMIMLSVATGWAVSEKFDGVAYAAHQGDHTIYPDCREEFIAAMKGAMRLCDWHPVELVSPFKAMDKTQIVQRGAELSVPFSETWSCYKGTDTHCGKCGTCVERKEAFELAKVPDPTVYQ